MTRGVRFQSEIESQRGEGDGKIDQNVGIDLQTKETHRNETLPSHYFNFHLDDKKDRSCSGIETGVLSHRDLHELLSHGYISDKKYKIGETSISTVFRGEVCRKMQPRTLRRNVRLSGHNQVAISVIDRFLTNDDFLKEKLPADMKCLLGMKAHPNVCLPYELVFGTRKVFLITEHHVGIDCVSYMKAQNFNEEKAMNIFIQISEGLHHVHNLGIIHQDLHPGCVIVNETGHTKIRDTGIHLNLVSLDDKHYSERTKHVYDAPEVIRSHKFISKEANMYSLGAIFYEMLHGRVPFDGPNDFILHAIYNDLINFDPNISVGVRLLLINLMQPDPWRRSIAKDVLMRACTLISDSHKKCIKKDTNQEALAHASPANKTSIDPLKSCAKSLATVRCGSEPIVLRSRIPDKKVAYALGVEYSEVCSSLSNVRETQFSKENSKESCARIPTTAESILHKMSAALHQAAKDIGSKKRENDNSKAAIVSALSVVPIRHQRSTSPAQHHDDDKQKHEYNGLHTVFTSRPASAESDMSVHVLNRCISDSTVVDEGSPAPKAEVCSTPHPKKPVVDGVLTPVSYGEGHLQNWIDEEMYKMGLLAGLDFDGSSKAESMTDESDAYLTTVSCDKNGVKNINKWIKRENIKAQVLLNAELEASTRSAPDSKREENLKESSDEKSAKTSKSTSQCSSHYDKDNSLSNVVICKIARDIIDAAISESASDDMTTLSTGKLVDYDTDPTKASSLLGNSRPATFEVEGQVPVGPGTPANSDGEYVWSVSGYSEENEEDGQDSSSTDFSSISYSYHETEASYRSDRHSSIPSNLGSQEPASLLDAKSETSNSEEVIIDEMLPLPPFTDDERVWSFLALLGKDRDSTRQIQPPATKATEPVAEQPTSPSVSLQMEEQSSTPKFKSSRNVAGGKKRSFNFTNKDGDGNPSNLKNSSTGSVIPPLRGESMNLSQSVKMKNSPPNLDFSIRPNLQVSSKVDSNIHGIKSWPRQNSLISERPRLGVVPVSFAQGASACHVDERPMMYSFYHDQIPSSPLTSYSADCSTSPTGSSVIQHFNMQREEFNSGCLATSHTHTADSMKCELQRSHHSSHLCFSKTGRPYPIATDSNNYVQQSRCQTIILPPIVPCQKRQRTALQGRKWRNVGQDRFISASTYYAHSRVGRLGF